MKESNLSGQIALTDIVLKYNSDFMCLISLPLSRSRVLPARPELPAIDCRPVVVTDSNNKSAQRLSPRDVNMSKGKKPVCVSVPFMQFYYTNSTNLLIDKRAAVQASELAAQSGDKQVMFLCILLAQFYHLYNCIALVYVFI